MQGPLLRTLPWNAALLTVWDGSRSFECALPVWCHNAITFQALTGLQPIVLSPNRSAECLGATFVWPTVAHAISRAAAAYMQRLSHEQPTRATQARVAADLLKWLTFALEFDFILFCDLDIDLNLPHSRKQRKPWLKGWAAATSAFMASPSTLFVGYPDFSAPCNSGLFLAKPRRWIVREALDALHRVNWSAAEGFDRVGSPRQVVDGGRALISRLAAGHGAGSHHAVRLLLKGTAFYRLNSWTFVGGQRTQGLLWYLIFLRHGVGTYASRGGGHDSSWAAEHYWGSGQKPWRWGTARRNPTLAAAYLRRIHPISAPLSRCMRQLDNMARWLINHSAWDVPRRTGQPDDAAAHARRTPVLPSVGLLNTFNAFV